MSDTSSMTRRDAVKVAAAAPLSAVLDSVQAANDQVAFGLIGGGVRGRDLLRRLNRVGSGRCVTVCDPNAAKLPGAVQTSAHKPQSCKDYRELLVRKDVQAVIVATPPHTHFAT